MIQYFRVSRHYKTDFHRVRTEKNQPISLFAPPTFPKKLHPWGNAARTARHLKQLKRSKKIEQVVAQSLIAVMLNAKKLGKYQAEVRHLSHA